MKSTYWSRKRAGAALFSESTNQDAGQGGAGERREMLLWAGSSVSQGGLTAAWAETLCSSVSPANPLGHQSPHLYNEANNTFVTESSREGNSVFPFLFLKRIQSVQHLQSVWPQGSIWHHTRYVYNAISPWPRERCIFTITSVLTSHVEIILDSQKKWANRIDDSHVPFIQLPT